MTYLQNMREKIIELQRNCLFNYYKKICRSAGAYGRAYYVFSINILLRRSNT